MWERQAASTSPWFALSRTKTASADSRLAANADALSSTELRQQFVQEVTEQTRFQSVEIQHAAAQFGGPETRLFATSS